MEAPALPFNVTRQGSDVFVSVESTGVMRIDGDDVVIEFIDTRTDHRSPGMSSEQSSLQEVRLALRDIDSVAYGRRMLRASLLEVRCTSMAALRKVPFAEGNRLMVRVARANRDRARGFSASVEVALADRVLGKDG